jgi:Na+/melibiose symporter-like transporter
VPAVGTADLVPVLQTAIGPVVMVSGVGLLLLTMTNRLGRVVDRARALARQLKEAADEEKVPIQAQLRILRQRAEFIRRAIALAAFCVLFAAILVISLFVTAVFNTDVPWLVAGLFILSMGCLIASVVYFIRDINKALVATKLEVGQDWE